MLLDYIGQELIWRLRGNQPYEQNSRRYGVTFRCKSKDEAQEIENFIWKHVEAKFIKCVTINNLNGRIERIDIENVFKCISTVNFLYI